MTYCLHCQVEVDKQHTHCPLCQMKLTNQTVNTPLSYPQYRKPKRNKKLRIKVWLYATIVLMTATITLNIFTWHLYPVKWSPIIVIASFYLWYLGSDIYRHFNINTLAKILWRNYLLLSALLIIIDVSFGFSRWSLNYGVPLTGIITGLLMTFWSLVNKSMWRDDIGYILLTLGINVIPCIVFLFEGITVLWPSLISLLYGLLTVLGLFIFSGKRLLYELQKRFHF